MSIVVMVNEKFRESVPPWEVNVIASRNVNFKTSSIFIGSREGGSEGGGGGGQER